MRSIIVPLVLISALVKGASIKKATTIKEAIFETFEHPNVDNACGFPSTCPDPLPGPVNGLTFSNLQAILVSYSENGGQQPYNGNYFAAISNVTEPAILSDKYEGSCVRSWTLSSLAIGCSSQQNETDPSSGNTYQFQTGANCSVQLVGKDAKGKTVGTEKFFYDPGPLTLNQYGFPTWPMFSYNTSSNGLKNKAIQTLSITATNIPPKDNPHDKYVSNFEANIDALHYTLTNRTKC